MLTRREAALGGLLSIGWLAAPCGCAAHAASGRERFGCELADDEFPLALTQDEKVFGPGGNPQIVESGNRDLDYAMAQTLSMLTDTWRVLPGFAYYDDSRAPNALATPKRWLSRPDGSVIFGRTLLAHLLKAREHPDVLISAVVAHEFGHIAQFKYGLKGALVSGQRTVKRLELHADFLAGYFAGVRKLQRPDFPAAVYAVLGHSGGNYQVERMDHHGTPDERANAIVKGFETSFRQRRDPGDALQIGLNYARTL
jgi:hypothetical protein